MTNQGEVQDTTAPARYAALAGAFGAIAINAGKTILDIRARTPDVRAKSDASPVTDADEQAEALILEALATLCPGIPVIAEEAAAAGKAPAAEAPLAGPFLLVDPLDGTREFVDGLDEFTVNIALIANGWPVAGAVYQPVTGRLWYGSSLPDGLAEAFTLTVASPAANPKPGQKRVLKTRRRDRATCLALISRAYADRGAAALEAAGEIAALRRMGSSLKFCWLAEGAADIYPRCGPTHSWDIAAGDAVLRAAGGVVLTLDGVPVSYSAGARMSPEFLALGDPSCAADLLPAIR